ncbi:hypothetical protein TRVL_07615 [Trypanosoma vivax]|uniref:Transmembrane protein n=1 Tax=Trypanosoma vivax (strain Y486) TaxID=1055687 RepID=G0UCA0_TRYVY|nr:hypothetical protein TRVL_07615 [Trypanosoma vivax]CCC53450.1 conserved hypothetical protein [Trypanosoma vivax Y486]
MRVFLQLGAGALFSLSIFVFIDGLVVAKKSENPFNFMMWLPFISMCCGMFVLNFVDAKNIVNNDWPASDSELSRDKLFFFVAAILMLCGFTIALWKAIDPYSKSSNSWAGVSLVIQSIFLLSCSSLLFYYRIQDEDEMV